MSASVPIPRPLKPGIYCPTMTFFLPGSEDLDLQSFETHIVSTARAGIGLVVNGTMGEAHHLDSSERIRLIKTARSALDRAGLNHTPIIAGTGGGSTRESIKFTKDAAEAGADCALVLISGFFSASLINDRAALKAFWREIAQESPIPIMIYNFPGAAGGIDLDSDIIEEMVMESPNICGIKLTCGNVGKLTRIASIVSSPSFTQNYPRKNPDSSFIILGGFADFILPSFYVRGHGAITGLSSISPYALIRLWGLSSDPSLLSEAQDLQGVIARADRTIALTGLAGNKWLIEKLKGYGGVCRKPLGPFSEDDGAKLWAHPHVIELLRLEKVYEQEAKAKMT